MFKRFIFTTMASVFACNAALADYPTVYAGASAGIIVNTTTSAANAQPGNFRGAPFNLFVGYGNLLDQNFYLAGEVFGTVGTGEISDKNGLKTTYGIGASLLPGLLLSDSTMIYARGGFVRSRFSNVSNLSTGVQLGLGMQMALMQSLDLRGEYDFTAYHSVSGISSPRQDAFTLGLLYKFT